MKKNDIFNNQLLLLLKCTWLLIWPGIIKQHTIAISQTYLRNERLGFVTASTPSPQRTSIVHFLQTYASDQALTAW